MSANSLPRKHVIGILADNLRLRGSVMPLSGRRLTAWARGLHLPRGGDTVIYTGHMYQMMPALGSLEAGLALAAKLSLTRLMGLGRWVNRLVDLSTFMTWPSGREQREYDGRLRRIAKRLLAAKVTFGYLYEKELYTGALLYDLGAEEVFRSHAQKVWHLLKAQGVKRVITVDPHTMDMLREVYPRYCPDYRMEVVSYLEVLSQAEAPAAPNAGKMAKECVALHDSCLYARVLDVVEPPRRLLAQDRRPEAEHAQSRAATHCCGGPLESLFPDKAETVARTRFAQLEQTGCKSVAAMCPICLHNLRKAAAGKGIEVRDFSEVLDR
ncbi:MAG: (Fe-S)-binding protein [candidate division FCPU426 bacterium]